MLRRINQDNNLGYQLTNWFNILGWPEKIRTDGGPQFRSEFDNFCKSFYIHHELSSPYHPESNGLAEAAVKNAKKCNMTGQNLQRSLSVLRNMPRSDGPSPVQLLFRLPQKTNILLPPWPMPNVDPASTLSAQAHHIKQRTATVNKRAFSYHRLLTGSKVHVQNAVNKLWDQQATVPAVRDNGESYVVRLDNGKQCIRGRILLRPANTTAAPEQSKSAPPVPPRTPLDLLFLLKLLYADLHDFKTRYKFATSSVHDHSPENIFR